MLLSTKNIEKQFHGVYALKEVSLEIEKGEILGLVGENGAGKSTLIKILTGVYSLDAGSILWNGEEIHIENPHQSQGLGIHVIHQDRQLVPTFSGYENCYLGQAYEVRPYGKIDWKKMYARVDALAEKWGIEMDFRQPAARLSPPEQTMLCILHALMTECRLLILDEPTASLTDRETEILFRMIRRLKEQGVSILYVSHRMDEIMTLTDRVTIMKNGSISGTFATAEITKEDLIRRMTDNWVSTQEENGRSASGEVLLSVEHLVSEDGRVKDISLTAHRGEILGIFGLGGSGRTEFLETLYGYRAKKEGTIRIGKQVIEKSSPADSIRNRMVMICEDRRGMALVMPFNIRKNITLSVLGKYSGKGIIRGRKEKNGAKESISLLGIKCNGPEQYVGELSGGNQQKVVFAKALQSDPEIFLCDEPTQAVDVKTRQEIHRLLRRRADEGCTVLYVSSDLQEILEVSDRVQVISHGTSGAVMENKNLTSEQVLRCCYQEA
ncbi:MAG: sugar ABC transporter ATP-binding protein [Eubacteriales bacterium]|nr:sugar ABC transporter ATP-binding protein [Eubacteriales bacterium]